MVRVSQLDFLPGFDSIGGEYQVAATRLTGIWLMVRTMCGTKLSSRRFRSTPQWGSRLIWYVFAGLGLGIGAEPLPLVAPSPAWAIPAEVVASASPINGPAQTLAIVNQEGLFQAAVIAATEAAVASMKAAPAARITTNAKAGGAGSVTGRGARGDGRGDGGDGGVGTASMAVARAAVAKAYNPFASGYLVPAAGGASPFPHQKVGGVHGGHSAAHVSHRLGMHVPGAALETIAEDIAALRSEQLVVVGHLTAGEQSHVTLGQGTGSGGRSALPRGLPEFPGSHGARMGRAPQDRNASRLACGEAMRHVSGVLVVQGLEAAAPEGPPRQASQQRVAGAVLEEAIRLGSDTATSALQLAMLQEPRDIKRGSGMEKKAPETVDEVVFGAAATGQSMDGELKMGSVQGMSEVLMVNQNIESRPD